MRLTPSIENNPYFYKKNMRNLSIVLCLLIYGFSHSQSIWRNVGANDFNQPAVEGMNLSDGVPMVVKNGNVYFMDWEQWFVMSK